MYGKKQWFGLEARMSECKLPEWIIGNPDVNARYGCFPIGVIQGLSGFSQRQAIYRLKRWGYTSNSSTARTKQNDGSTYKANARADHIPLVRTRLLNRP